MSVERKDTVDHRTEKAIAAYFRGYRDPASDDPENDEPIELASILDGDLAGIPVYEGRQTSERTFPCIVVSVPSASRMYQGVDWFTLTVAVELHTHRSESDNGVKRAEIVHAWRAKAIDEMLFHDPFMLAINKPEAPAEDLRDVQNITVIGIASTEMSADVQASAHVARWEIEMTVAPWDAVPS